MNGWRSTLAAIAGFSSIIGANAGAGEAQLSPEELAGCASQVQTLRADSVRLLNLHEHNEERRSFINSRYAALQAERRTIDPNDLAKGLDFRQRMQLHVSDAAAFNADIDQLRRELIAINALKTDYDQNCAQRPYRRTDLDALPEPAREAMRAGLSGVQVPYLDPQAAVAAPETRSP